MSDHFSSDSASRSLPNTLDLQMLCEAQACLRSLHAYQTPSAAQIEAFRSLHATYDPVIRSFIMVCGVPAEDADDCCQDVWEDIHINLTTFHSDGTQARFCSWLKKIAHSKATNFLRHRLRHPTRRLGPHAEASLPSRDADSVETYERHCVQEEVHRVLAILHEQVSEISFRVFWMRAFEERTTQEVATELHLTAAQVCCLFFRAKNRFQYLWERLMGDEPFGNSEA